MSAFSRTALNFCSRLLLFLHKSTHQLRRLLLLSAFGHISECRHSPTCSEYFATQVQKYGWRGLWRGTRRLFSCF